LQHSSNDVAASKVLQAFDRLMALLANRWHVQGSIVEAYQDGRAETEIPRAAVD
jgi:hypothetical protein